MGGNSIKYLPISTRRVFTVYKHKYTHTVSLIQHTTNIQFPSPLVEYETSLPYQDPIEINIIWPQDKCSGKYINIDKCLAPSIHLSIHLSIHPPIHLWCTSSQLRSFQQHYQLQCAFKHMSAYFQVRKKYLCMYVSSIILVLSWRFYIQQRHSIFTGLVSTAVLMLHTYNYKINAYIVYHQKC